MKTIDKLRTLHACPEALAWVETRGLKTSWRDCPRGDWMLWLAGALKVDRKLLVLAACDCAETALKFVPKGEVRPARAIQTARDWCEGKATAADCRKAADAAEAIYATDAAIYAACAAADAACAACHPACVAPAYGVGAADAAPDADAAHAGVGSATYATDTAYARAGAHKVCADRVRKRIPYTVIKENWK